MPVSVDEFVAEYSKAIDGNVAAIFAGAGLSVPGFKNWPDLLREVAATLKLDVDKETDLVALAQFHFNERKVRTSLTQCLTDEYDRDVPLTDNQELIAKLPIGTVWTTNYDRQIEKAFEKQGKHVDVKVTTANFGKILRDVDCTIYKMHGDISQPQDAVLLKDDYERYGLTHDAFATALKGDLVNKTFLFIGFSFTDTNIDWILSRIRILMGENPRQHYCIMKWPDTPSKSADGASRADFDYRRRRLELRVSDLQRYGIEAVMIDDWSEITAIFRRLNKIAYRNNVFVSGSAEDFSPLGEDRTKQLMNQLGRELISNQLNLVSGLGVGIGNLVLLAALEQVYQPPKTSVLDRIMIRPFPQMAYDDSRRSKLHNEYRFDILTSIGYLIVVSGNKSNTETGAIETAKGVMDEYQIAKDNKIYPIPIGATGWAARQIWEEVVADLPRFYGTFQVSTELVTLGDASKTDEEMIKAVLRIIRLTNH